jgi:hypothetical protein
MYSYGDELNAPMGYVGPGSDTAAVRSAAAVRDDNSDT